MESFWLLERMPCTANEHSHANGGVRPKTMLSGVASMNLDASICRCVVSAILETSGVEVVLTRGEEKGTRTGEAKLEQ